MKSTVAIALLLTACSPTNQTFSKTNDTVYGADGFAEITWSPNEIVFTEMEPMITYSQEFLVTSTGDSALMIDKVDITNSAEGVFYVDTSETQDVNLAPEVERAFIVIAQATETGVYLGEARIKSNDAVNRDVRIPLCGFPVGYDGTTTCDSLMDLDDTASDPTDTGEQTDTGTEE